MNRLCAGLLAASLLMIASCSSDKGTESTLPPQVNLSAYLTSTTVAAAGAAHGDWMNTLVIGGQKIVKLSESAKYKMALIANDGTEFVVVDNDQIVQSSDPIPWELVDGTYELHPFSIIFADNLLEDYQGFVLYGQTGSQQQELHRQTFAPATLTKLREVFLNEDPDHGVAFELQEAFEEAGHHTHELEEAADLTTIQADATALLAMYDALVASAQAFHTAADEVKSIDASFTAKHAVVIAHCETELPELLELVRPHINDVLAATTLTEAQAAAAEAHEVWHGHAGVSMSSIVSTILTTLPKFDIGEGLKADEHTGHDH